MKRCPYITDASVIVLAKKCLQLKSITLEHMEITDASLLLLQRTVASYKMFHLPLVTTSPLPVSLSSQLNALKCDR